MPRKPADDEKDLLVVSRNRKARHEFTIIDSIEAGLVLTGSEVKSIRDGNVVIQDAFARVDDGIPLLYNMEIAKYPWANHMNHEPKRIRQLLLNKAQIRRMQQQTMEKGLTIVALQLHFRRGLAKMDLGVARGKKLFDKREDMKKRDAKREIDRSSSRK